MISFNPKRIGGALALAALFAVSACSNKAQKADPKLNDPPADGEAAIAMPEGPPVVRQGRESGESSTEPAELAEGEVYVTRAELDEFLNRGPSYVLTIVSVEPQHGAEGFVGHQITEVTTEARAFMTPQMRVGDVVTHINGVRQLRPEDFMQAWRSLDKVDSVRVDFNRRGEAMNAVWIVK